jgi:transcriptional regulator with XRE-family HTH domain
VAEEVRVALARRQMSGVKLAQQIGKSQVYVSRRLRGEVAFDVMDLALVAEALGISVTDLLPKRLTAEWLTGERVIATVGAERPTRHRPIIPRPVAGPPTRPVTQTRPTSRPENRPSLTVAV